MLWTLTQSKALFEPSLVATIGARSAEIHTGIDVPATPFKLVFAPLSLLYVERVRLRGGACL